MGSCPKCGERIDEVIAEPIAIMRGAMEYVGTAFPLPPRRVRRNHID
jgi:hypothetical protein